MWYYYLNYKIYSFYKKKKDSTPVAMAFFVSILLIYFNLFTVLYLIDPDSFIEYTIYYSKIKSIGLGISLGIINYFILYRKKKYVDIFDNFDTYLEKYQHWDQSVKMYIIFSIVICLGTLVYADFRNHNYELYFLEWFK